MYIPEWFEETLQRDFNGRFLIRWSSAKQCFALMERVARGVAIRPARLHQKLQRLSEADREEFLFRLRTGTNTFVSIYPGARCACPSCGAKVLLEKHRWQFAHCAACGKDFNAVAYELGHLLLERLRFLNLETGGDERIIAEMDTADAESKRQKKRDDRNYLEAVVKEDFNQIMNIQSVGYTGKEQSWQTS